MYLLDTNVLSEMRKASRTLASSAKMDSRVKRWINSVSASDLHVSVVSILELERGFHLLEQRDRAQAEVPDLSFPTVLYGAAYYNEYMPGDDADHVARLDEGRCPDEGRGPQRGAHGRVTWSLWEPEDGRFEYAWMDRVVDAMGKAGIKVILGTPTYSIPAWMAHQHPEILADRIPGGMFGGQPIASAYGIRQNMDTDSPAYRFYAERLIRHIVAHYKDNPTVIGWQLDNETSSYDAANPDVFIGFQHYLEKKFGTPEALSKAWFLNYWGENLHTWEDLPGATAPFPPVTSWSGRAGARCASPTFCIGRRAGARVRGREPVHHHRLRRHDEARRERRGRRRFARHRGRQHLSRNAGPLRRLFPGAAD
jgi:hypothetical protein